VFGTRHPQHPQPHAFNHSVVNSVPQQHPRLSRALNTRRRLHRLPQGRESDIRLAWGANSVVGPARGLVAALSIADPFGSADQSVIHNVYGTPTHLRYPDSACVCNIDIRDRYLQDGCSGLVRQRMCAVRLYCSSSTQSEGINCSELSKSFIGMLSTSSPPLPDVAESDMAMFGAYRQPVKAKRAWSPSVICPTA
jgi:hypothetical protein